MKELKEAYYRVNNAITFKERYPQFNAEDNKIHVLYLSPCLNENGYYRMMLPAFELNLSDSHCAIIGNIHKWDFNKLFDDYDSPVDFRLIAWADYVVLPAMFTDVTYIVDKMREINDSIEFVMDMEMNYHELPEYHPGQKWLTKEMKDALLLNLSKIDILTAPNSQIINYYRELVDQSEQDFTLHLEIYPNLLSQFTYEEISKIQKNGKDKIRIGIISDGSQAEDLQTITEPVTELLKKGILPIELIIYGWPAKVATQFPFFKDFTVSYVNPVSIEDYHYRLNSLSLDIGLIPMVDNKFNNSGKAFTRFLDFSANMIPVVTSNILPFKKIITEGVNGFIASSNEEWFSKTENLIINTQLRKEVGNSAFKNAWEKYSYSPKALQRLKSIFI